MWCYVMLCYIISYHIILYYIILCYIILYYIIYTWILAMKSRLALMQYSKGVKSLHKLLMSADNSQVSAHSNVLCQEPLKKSQRIGRPWKMSHEKLPYPILPILFWWVGNSMANGWTTSAARLWPLEWPLEWLKWLLIRFVKIWPIILLLILPVFRCVQQSHQTHQTPRRND